MSYIHIVLIGSFVTLLHKLTDLKYTAGIDAIQLDSFEFCSYRSALM